MTPHEAHIASLKRQYLSERELYRNLQGSLYPAIVYMRLLELKRDFEAAGGHPEELPSTPRPTYMGRVPSF